MVTNASAGVESARFTASEQSSGNSEEVHKDTDLTSASNQEILLAPAANTAGDLLPTMELGDGSEQHAGGETQAAWAARNATLVHDALTATTAIGGFWSPDTEKLKNILGSANQQERQLIEQAYEQQYGQTLRHDLNERVNRSQFAVGDWRVDYRVIEAMLDREDGETNSAGNVRVALAQSEFGDQSKGSRMLRAAVSTLNSEQFNQMVSDYESRYGNFAEAIQNAPGITDTDRYLMLNFYNKGVEGRTTSDIVDASKAILNSSGGTNDDLARMYDVLAGSSDAAVQARQQLNSDPSFMQAYQDRFQNYWGLDRTTEQVAKDLMAEGRISLATIATGNADSLIGFFDNPDNTTLAMQSATPEERRLFASGRDLALSNQEPTSAEQNQALEYYQKLHGALAHDGERLRSMWEDQLLHGEPTLVSKMAETHSDGTNLALFTVGAGHDRNELMSAVETMSEADWKRLKDPATSQQFRQEIDASLALYASEEERTVISELLDRKAGAATFEESQRQLRTIEQVIADNPYSITPVAGRLSHMSADEAARFKNDAAYRDSVNSALREMSPMGDQDIAALVLSLGLVERAGSTGTVPEMGPLEQYAQKLMQNGGTESDQTSRMVALGGLLSDPAFASRMAAVNQAYESNDPMGNAAKLPTQDFWAYQMLGGRMGTPWEQLLQDNGESSNAAVVSDFNLYDKYSLVAKLPDELMKLKRSIMQPEQLAILDTVIAQGGEMHLADRVRSVAVGDRKSYDDGGKLYQQVQAELAKLTPEQQQQTAAEYEQKYGTKMAEDLVNSVEDPNERAVLSHVAQQNWQSTLADRMRLFVTDRGGSYSEFQSELAGLNPESRQQLLTDYTQKYGGNIADDFVSAVPEAQRQQYLNYFSPPSDGTQGFFDQVAADPETGMSADASGLTIDRLTELRGELLQEYHANRQSLPVEVQQALDAQFAEAFEQNRQSQEKLAKVVFDATLTAAAAVAMFTTGGLSAPAIVALIPRVAGASALYRVAVMSEIEGDHFDASAQNITKQAVFGAFMGALVVAPFAIGKTGATAEVSAEELASQATANLDRAVGIPVAEAAGEPVVEPVVEAAAEPVVEAAAVETAAEPVVAAGAEPVVEGTVVKAATEPVVEAPVVEAVTEPVVEAPVVEAATEPVVEAPVVEAATEPVVEAPIVEAATEPVIEAPVVEAATEPVIEAPVVEAATEPVVEAPVVEAATEPVVEAPVVEAATEPVVEAPVVEAATEPVVEAPVVEAATEPVVEAPVVEAATEPVVEAPVVEAATEPVVEVATEPVVEAAAEPVVEVAAREAAAIEAGARLETAVARLGELVNEAPAAVRAVVAPVENVLATLKNLAGGAMSREAMESFAANVKVIAEQLQNALPRLGEMAPLVGTIATELRTVSNALIAAGAAGAISFALDTAGTEPPAEVDKPAAAAPPAEVTEQVPEEVEKPAAPEMVSVMVPTESLVELARVRDGEGYWQTAERIMSEYDGAEPGDVMALTRELQKFYAAEQGDRMLMSGYRFIRPDNIEALVGQIQDETVKNAILSMTETHEEPSNSTPEATTDAPKASSDLFALAVVNPGEGYWHVASRIVDAKMRQDNSYDTYHAGAIVEALQTLHGDAVLQPGEKLITEENFAALMEQVKDSEVKALLLEYTS